jgi:hypothetical protein
VAEDGDTPCEVCRVLWPADALVEGVCPDCVDAEIVATGGSMKRAAARLARKGDGSNQTEDRSAEGAEEKGKPRQT